MTIEQAIYTLKLLTIIDAPGLKEAVDMAVSALLAQQYSANMSQNRFIANDDMFGAYVKIPTSASMAMHTYKVVGRIESNRYCDVPIMAGMRAILHSEIIPILNVVHCGVSEDTIIKVALSDCEIVHPPNAPLTLNELREMEGEPVWGVQISESTFFHDAWMLVTEYGAIDRKQSMTFCEYGKTWLAYRHKPEDGTK